MRLAATCLAAELLQLGVAMAEEARVSPAPRSLLNPGDGARPTLRLTGGHLVPSGFPALSADGRRVAIVVEEQEPEGQSLRLALVRPRRGGGGPLALRWLQALWPDETAPAAGRHPALARTLRQRARRLTALLGQEGFRALPRATLGGGPGLHARHDARRSRLVLVIPGGGQRWWPETLRLDLPRACRYEPPQLGEVRADPRGTVATWTVVARATRPGCEDAIRREVRR